MSANKYANLPDIDTAPDIYETDDVFPSSQTKQGESSDEESGLPARHALRGRNGETSGKEELDNSNLIGAEEASKKFKRAERKRTRDRSIYQYPRSRTPSPSPSHPPSLSGRLRLLQAELASLETELGDPSNPLLQKEREEEHVDPGELIKGLVDVKSRLEKFSVNKEGRVRLVNEVLKEESAEGLVAPEPESKKEESKETSTEDKEPVKTTLRDTADMDRRVGELEKLVGSASASLDETSPMPPPLLPLLTRLNTQLTVLTQPRHLDNISRRLKLLLTDLERVSSSTQQHRRQSHHPEGAPPPVAAPSVLQEQMMPILTRLVPNLPHIPHILTRLRTLSTLHTSAAEFQSTLEGLEEDQKKVREGLEELSKAVESVEGSLQDNNKLVRGNVSGLEERIDTLMQRLEKLEG
ncbi:hypothetical protein EVG20_g3122 [Dentipellis fragilis]|uniref:Dynamitin n=1 Tax=Dentipellis fragilis TaxID=205917 RepID=A0A4Y9Z4J9_9AGAM|nr:hypothetical protein EVG20_g3122 [Dentipellis fragilis]